MGDLLGRVNTMLASAKQFANEGKLVAPGVFGVGVVGHGRRLAQLQQKEAGSGAFAEPGPSRLTCGQLQTLFVFEAWSQWLPVVTLPW